MKNQSGVTLVTVIIMVIIISVIAATSIITSKTIFNESKESVLEKNRVLVETAVSKYAAKAATGGVLAPANEKFPGVQNPSFEYVGIDEDTGMEIRENRNVGNDWYLLLEDSLEDMGITYADENYLVNYKKNIVVPLSESNDIFALVEYYKTNY